MPDACIVALVGDEVVGYTAYAVEASASPIAENLLTAVRRPWRRRDRDGPQARADRAGPKAGVEQIYTTNDETNVGMRGVNERLGYRPAPTRILVSGPLAT